MVIIIDITQDICCCRDEAYYVIELRVFHDAADARAAP